MIAKKGVMFLGAFVAALACGAGEITVTASAVEKISPDRMELSFLISARDPDMAVSRRLFGEKNSAVAAALAQAGVATNEVKSAGVSVYHDRDWDDEKKKYVNEHYRTKCCYRISLPLDIERCDRIYAVLVQSKAVEDFDVDFELAPETADKAGREARRKAVAKARALADELCGHLGGSCGEVVRIEYRSGVEDEGCDYMMSCVGSDEKSTLMSFTPEDIEVGQSVRVVYKIVPGAVEGK